MIEISGVNNGKVFAEADWTAGTFRVANTQRIRKQLEWQPRISLRDGLRMTLDWLREK